MLKRSVIYPKTKHNVDTSCVRHELANGGCSAKQEDNLLKHSDIQIKTFRITNRIDIKALTENKNAEIIGGASNSIDQTCANASWEIRAFFTCLLIAVQTVLLTGPINYGFWVDVVTRNPSSLQLKFILGFSYLLAGLMNLFVYTWRFQEVRKEFRHFDCGKE